MRASVRRTKETTVPWPPPNVGGRPNESGCTCPCSSPPSAATMFSPPDPPPPSARDFTLPAPVARSPPPPPPVRRAARPPPDRPAGLPGEQQPVAVEHRARDAGGRHGAR